MEEDVLGESSVEVFPDGGTMASFERGSLCSKVTEMISVGRWWSLPVSGPVKPIQECDVAKVQRILKKQHMRRRLDMRHDKVRLTLEDTGESYIEYYWNEAIPSQEGMNNLHTMQLSGTLFDVDVVAHFL